MFLLRLAYAYRKVLIIVWTHPMPVDDFLVPNAIDWTPSGLPQRILNKLYSTKLGRFDFQTRMSSDGPARLKKMALGKDVQGFREERMVRMQVNVPYGTQVNGVSDQHLTRNSNAPMMAVYGR
jgi:hypothetical protein